MANEHFTVERADGVTRVYLANTKFYDVPRYAEMREEFIGIVESERPEKLLVHFDEVEYCSTAVISALLAVRELQLARGDQVKFCGMNENVRMGFQMLNLDGSVFDIYEEPQEAVAAF